MDPATIDPNSRHGRLLRAMMAAIGEVMDANQSTINAKGIGFKAFIPAVFGRLVGESFARLANGEAELKVTAPPELVRNRKARPDAFEEKIIKTKLVEASWPRGQPYSEMTDAKGRPAYRVMVPEYYAASCLTCHGGPKGEMDITGYPKEGASRTISAASSASRCTGRRPNDAEDDADSTRLYDPDSMTVSPSYPDPVAAVTADGRLRGRAAPGRVCSAG